MSPGWCRVGADTTYHHGDLARAAVAAATELVDHAGTATLTLRAVAERVGVSHPALYRHFANRDALLDRVAAGWITALVEATAASDLTEFVSTYATAATSSRHLYRCAFDAAADVAATQTAAALSTLRDRAAGAYAAATGVHGTELRDGVLRLWGTVHGMVDLYFRGLVRARSPRAAATYITTSTLRRVLPPASPS
jgi:AcrR family transcriptional regulator